MSMVLALSDFGEPSVSGDRLKAEMRRRIEDRYFGSASLDTRKLEPYQVLLREAQQAYTRGDQKTQRSNYRKVLDMLRAERGFEDKGLTGSRSSDEDLKEALSVLLKP